MGKKKRHNVNYILTACVLLLYLGLPGYAQLNFEPGIDYTKFEKNASLDMVVQSSHNESINCLAFSPDGKFLLSGGNDNTIKLWRINDKKILKTYIGHTGPVYSVVFSPDGEHFATSSSDCTGRLWRIDGKLIKILDLGGYHSSAYSIAFSPKGDFLAGICGSRAIALWDLSGNLIKNLDLHVTIESLCIHADAKLLAGGGSDGSVRIWNLQGDLIREMSGGHTARIAAIAFSPDGRYLATGGGWGDGMLKLWSLDGKLIGSQKGHKGKVSSIAFSPNGKYIASGGDSEFVKLWSSNLELVRSIEVEKSHTNYVTFNPDSEIIAASSAYWIYNFNLAGKVIEIFSDTEIYAESLAMDPDGKHIAIGGPKGSVRLWNLGGKPGAVLSGLSGPVSALAFSPDGSYLAAVGLWDKKGILWNKKGKHIQNVKSYFSFTRSLAVSPDGNLIALASNLENDVQLVSPDGKKSQLLKGHSGTVTSLAFSPDGRFLASSSADKTIKLWNNDGKLINTLSGPRFGAYGLVFSPNGRYLLGGGSYDRTIYLLNLKEGSVKRLEENSYVFGVAFSPDGRYLASCGGDEIKLWDYKLDQIKAFKAHANNSRNLMFSPDSKFLIYTSSNSVRVLNILNGYSYTLILLGKEWIIYTPDGYFDASQNGGSLVAMVKGLTDFGVDQFAIKNNRPDIIFERMGLADEEFINHLHSRYKKRLRRMNFTEEQLSLEYHAPEVKIIEARQKDKYLDLNFILSDEIHSLKKYNIFINDVPILGAYGREIQGNRVALSERVELTSGENKIEVTCFNEKGAESVRALVYANYNRKTIGDLYFLGFGVSRYSNSDLNLQYADKDVMDLADTFSMMKGEYFKEVYIKTYLNEEVTLQNISAAKAFLKKAVVDDTVVLMVSGHGVNDVDDEATYYYLTHNADIENLSKTCADFALIESLIQNIVPRNKLFLMDTCESGEIDEDVQSQYYTAAQSRGIIPRTSRGLTFARTEIKKKRSYLYDKNRYIYNDLLRRSGAIIFSSSRGGELSYEKDSIQNGFFTEAIITGLKGREADVNRDGVVSTDELRDYVSQTVSIETEDLQHPTVDRDNIYQKFGFPVIRRGGGYTEGRAPEKAPAEGVYVLFEIYTFDEITPKGGITLLLNNVYDRDQSIELIEYDSKIPGLSLFKRWVLLKNVETAEYTIAFKNAAGKFALSPYMKKNPKPSYRLVDSNLKTVWELDHNLKQYAYRDIIRHWENSPPGLSYLFAGCVNNGKGDPCEVSLSVSNYHQTNSGNMFGYEILPDSPVYGDFSIILNKLMISGGEVTLPLRDEIEFSFKKNFYSELRIRRHYSELDNTELGTIVMYANRIITFDWIYSERGVYQGKEIPKEGKLNTVNIFSFPDMIEGIDYYKSMFDPRLDDYYLNQYNLDNDGDSRDLRAYFKAGSLSLRGYKTKTGIFDLGIGDIPKDIDISGLSFTNRAVVDEPGHVYAVRTSSGGFALIKVRDIHIMTSEEMVRFKKQ